MEAPYDRCDIHIKTQNDFGFDLQTFGRALNEHIRLGDRDVDPTTHITALLPFADELKTGVNIDIKNPAACANLARCVITRMNHMA